MWVTFSSVNLGSFRANRLDISRCKDEFGNRGWCTDSWVVYGSSTSLAGAWNDLKPSERKTARVFRGNEYKVNLFYEIKLSSK